MDDAKIKSAVRNQYGRIAKAGARAGEGCCVPATSCCAGADVERLGSLIGYSEKEQGSVPEGANLGLGCGNPVALASLKEGEIVLDLGSGGGFDCFLAANKVGKTGKVIGVDMTPEMVERAGRNAREGGYRNVEFRLGEIESLPLDDDSVDVVISNCAINLSPDKGAVFREAFRVLRPGGRLFVSDIVLRKELPESLKNDIAVYVGCVAGAMLKEKYIQAIRSAGFGDVNIMEETSYDIGELLEDPATKAVIDGLGLPEGSLDAILGSAVSIRVSGIK